VAAGGCARSASVTPKPAVPSPFLALRLAFAEAASGREAARYGDTTVFLARDVLMSDDDVLSVRHGAGPDGELVLRVWYRPAAAQRLATATGAHLGDQLAMLLDSRVWSLARIQSPIGRGDSLTIGTSATGADAERLTAQIRSKWPPR
jgi:preprotein translocase subunit SecD